MTLFPINRTYRHIRRYRQIIGTLVKYGFGDLLQTMTGVLPAVPPKAFARVPGQKY